MEMTKLEREIMNDEITPVELLDYFRFKDAIEDLTIQEVEEYIENIKNKFAEVKTTRTGEKLSAEQINARKRLQAQHKKVTQNKKTTINKNIKENKQKTELQSIFKKMEEEGVKYAEKHLQSNTYNKLIDLEQVHEELVGKLDFNLLLLEEKYGELTKESKEKYITTFLECLRSSIMKKHIH